MKNQLLILLAIIGLTLPLNAQENQYRETILNEAGKMGKAFIAKDYETFAKFSHPTTIVMMGGHDTMMKFIKSNFEQLEAEGVSFLDVTFGEPTQIIPIQNKDLNVLELQCTLPQSVKMGVPGGKVTANTTLIAVSRDNGTNWYFADVSGNNLETMRKIIPTLSPKLVIPQQEEPVFVPDEETENND